MLLSIGRSNDDKEKGHESSFSANDADQEGQHADQCGGASQYDHIAYGAA